MKRAVLACVVAALGLAPPAQATFPGANGRIAYTWSVGGEAFEEGPTPRLVGVVSIRPDGSDRRVVARRGREPAYSPDGRRIAFLRGQRLWVARAGGASAHPVTPRGWLVGQQEWSPGGTRLAFVRAFEANVRTVLYSVEPDGRGLRVLARAPMPIGLFPGGWSPNGRGIVYEQPRFSGSLARVVRAGRVMTVANGATEPTWSSRGRIAYETPRRVCLVEPHPEAHTCVGSPDGIVGDPSWLPDGGRLLVTYVPRDGAPAERWTVSPDGTVMTRAPVAGAARAILSPDGRRIVSSVTRGAGQGEDFLQFADLFVEGLDGTNRGRLVRGGQAQSPDWQPRP